MLKKTILIKKSLLWTQPSPDIKLHRPQIPMRQQCSSVSATTGVQMANIITKIIKKKIGFVCSYKNLLN